MVASKHTIYLTRNHRLVGNGDSPTNAFLFNTHGPLVRACWVSKNIELNEGSFIVLDHKKTIFKMVEKSLLERNYYVESVDFGTEMDTCCVNPFDLVHDTSEIHFMFLNFLHVMWDNADPDIAAMSNLIDAFASCLYFMFINQREKMNMRALQKMVYSCRSKCQTDDGESILTDAIFAGLKDQESMPCKYYAQFKRAAGERYEEVAEKLAKVFDMFTERDLQMMDATDWDLADSLRFKTAVFVNVNREEEEHSAKLLLILLNYLIQQAEKHGNVLFILDNMSANYSFASLPYWMKEASKYSMSFLLICDDVAKFASSPRTERYFKHLQDAFSASVLTKFNAETKATSGDMDKMKEECVATVIIPSNTINEQDVLF